MNDQNALPYEDDQLNRALQKADVLLSQSLRRQDRRRRMRRALAAAGGMLVIAAGVVAWQAGAGRQSVAARSAVGSVASEKDAAKAAELMQEGWALWSARKYGDAEAKFLESLKLNPESANAWNGLGWSRFNNGKARNATEAFERALKIEPAMPAALNGLGQIHLSQRQYDKAEQYLLKAAPLAPAAHYGLARLYLLQGQFEKAEEWAKKVVAAVPDDAVATRMLAAAQAKKLDDDLRKLIEPPPPTSAGVQRGWQLLNSGQHAEAIEAFNAVLKQNPNDADALNGLGWVMLNTGKVDEAQKRFQAALKQDANAAGALNGLARTLKAQGKTQEAIETWKQMEKIAPGIVTAGTHGLAFTYLELEQYDKALPYLKELAKAMPDDEAVKAALEKAAKAAR